MEVLGRAPHTLCRPLHRPEVPWGRYKEGLDLLTSCTHPRPRRPLPCPQEHIPLPHPIAYGLRPITCLDVAEGGGEEGCSAGDGLSLLSPPPGPLGLYAYPVPHPQGFREVEVGPRVPYGECSSSHPRTGHPHQAHHLHPPAELGRTPLHRGGDHHLPHTPHAHPLGAF